VHGRWTEKLLAVHPEAVERGYVVIAPEYRGSTGYGEAHHNAIDYGGYEVEDVTTAYDWMVANLPHVDPERVGIMGWSHGGYISILAVTARGEHPFKAAVANVPVTNLFFRLSYKGPGYQRSFATQERIGGLPFERREIYIERSPYYTVEKLEVPLLVHVATNDTDVNFEEAEPLIYKLNAEAAPDGNQDLRGPGALGQFGRPRVQPSRRPRDAGAGGLTRADRFVEPDVDVPGGAPSAVQNRFGIVQDGPGIGIVNVNVQRDR
jgi:dienelactone hydrolase